MSATMEEVRLKGVPICRGIAIGVPFYLVQVDNEVAEFILAPKEVEGEVKRYLKAVEQSRKDVRDLQKKLEREEVLEGAAILDAHLQMMQDPLMTTHVAEEIRSSRKNAEFVFLQVIELYQKKFLSLKDPFFRERFKDIQDISKRVMVYLRESTRTSLTDLPPDSIVFSKELAATDTAEADTSTIAGFVTEMGGATSHAAIVAKARGIPFVTNIEMGRIPEMEGGSLIIDGRTGEVIFNPAEDTLKKYRSVQSGLRNYMQKLRSTVGFRAETFDGYRIRLLANIDSTDEVGAVAGNGADGIGLFRSEYLFLNRYDLPTEQEQYLIYRKIAQKLAGMPIVFRTFDFGGDKGMPNGEEEAGGSPYLGCRSIRYLLKERDVFKEQIRAVLRAAAYGNVSLMFPMISSLQELLEAKAIVEEVKAELKSCRLKHHAHIAIGCMIEVPSAAVIADLLAKECDFLSIGTNDLVQFSLAADRRDQHPSSFYNPSDPSVLRLIKLIVSEGNQHGIPVTVCGEVAADPRYTALLLGLGVHELSVAARYIPQVKHAVRSNSIVAATYLAEHALTLTSASDIEDLLFQHYRKQVPEDHLFPVLF